MKMVLKPFISFHSTGIDSSRKDKSQELYKLGLDKFQQNDFSEAEKILKNLFQLIQFLQIFTTVLANVMKN